MIDILVPTLPESVSDATLVVWHKKPGDWVEAGDNLADLETDKVILEVPAPLAGVLKDTVHNSGDTVVSGELLAYLDTRQEAVTGNKTTEPVLTPSVRKLVAENELDPNQISGTGKHGRILKSDVMDYLDTQQPREMTTSPDQPSKPSEPYHAPKQVPLSATAVASLRPEQRVPMTRLRAKIAERLLHAQQNAAMLTTFNEVDLKAVIDLRNQYKERFESKHNIKLGFMSFFVKASIEALKRFPAINASIDGNDIIYHGYYDIGIAVTTPRGLIVPILRDADQLDFAGIEKGIHDFGNKARNGSISVEDLTGGTFTITNGGIFGSMLSTPILNPPQCAIGDGYSSTEPEKLIIWEAQFGDFANGAQVVIDQFISSGETKWGKLSGLVMLLPHGFEGQGPEHSSARLERYLQLCADQNIQVCYPSTPAQIFHLLRRQLLRQYRKPLIIMSPKSLLRHKLATSKLDDLAQGQFQTIIGEVDDIDPFHVTRLILCSGKVYYDLLEARRQDNLEHVAVIRIEQLYPFPSEQFKNEIEKYPNIELVVWCQEEPKNQGAWYQSKHHFFDNIQKDVPIIYAGRVASAAPAVGNYKTHLNEQRAVVQTALYGHNEGKKHD